MSMFGMSPQMQFLTNFPVQSAPASTMLTAPSGGSFGQGLAQGLQTAGPIMAMFGAANSAIGAYYSSVSQQNALRMQAQNQRFAAEMGRINRRQAEFTAAQVGIEGERRIGAYTMGAGQRRAGARASLAGRGVQLGVGSAGEVIGSMDVMKEIDVLTMSAQNVRAREAARLQAFNVGVGATMADISAANLQATAGTIYPGLAVGTSLLGSAAEIGGMWARNRRFEELLRGVSTQRL